MMKRLYFYRLLMIGLILLAAPAFWQGATAQTIDELREELSNRKDTLKEAEAKIKRFREEIQLKKREARSLEEQIGIIEDNINQISLSIEETIAEVEITGAEISLVEKEIEEKEAEIKHQKELLAEFIRSIYSTNQQSSVAIFLKYATFSEAVSEAETLQNLQERSHQALLVIKDLREQLEQKHTDLKQFKEALEKLQARQAQQQATLVANRQSKEHVLDLTKAQESQYQSLLKESQRAHQEAEAEINKLDSLIREELRKQGVNKLPSVGVFDWPVEAIFGISCVFHCTDYPYAYLIGPHSGMDIPTYVGTPVLAPADGYVGRVRNAGGPGYNYILLLHGDGVSTVFGHLSGFAVNEGQMVSRGTVMGYTGGAPGTNGAGLSSGPHLHFEVRVNNVAVDPNKYL